MNEELHTMERLEYEEFHIRNYFMNPLFNTSQVKLIFRFRTRMLQFGENYRGGRETIPCPLCNSHIDSQAFVMECSTIRQYLIASSCDLDNLYTDYIDRKTVEALEEAINIREKLLRQQK